MFLTFNEQASRYSVKSLTSKLAAAVMNLQRSARPSGPHHFIHNSAAQARVKCSKGNFTTVPVLMNSSDEKWAGDFSGATMLADHGAAWGLFFCVLVFGSCYDSNASLTRQDKEHGADGASKVQVASELHGSTLSALILCSVSWPEL